MPASLNIRLPQQEAKTLEAYAAAMHCTKSEIVRGFIRSLSAAKPSTGNGCSKPPTR